MNELAKQARATEYKGVCYRSKSEAILAYCMDKAGYEFEYEPNLKCDGLEWKPDFIVCEKWSNCIFLIEYKPSEPSETYLKWIKNEFKKVKKLNCSNLLGCGEEAFIDTAFVFINNFYDEQTSFCVTIDDWPEDAIGMLLARQLDRLIKPNIKNAKRYRFDLKHATNELEYEQKEKEQIEDVLEWGNRSNRPSDREFWFLKLICSPQFNCDWVLDILDVNWISHLITRDAFQKVIDARKSNKWLGAQTFLSDISIGAQEMIQSALDDSKEIPNYERQIPDVMQHLRNQFLTFRIRELGRMMDDPKLEITDTKLIGLMKQRQELEILKRQPVILLEYCE